MARRVALAATLAASLAAFSCDSEEGSSGSGTQASAASSSASGAGGGDPTPAESCTKPGDKGNDKGVGEYCTPGGDECDNFPEAPLCLATVGQDQWFCTRIGCKAGDDCGEAAVCLIEPDGSACVPNRCLDDGVGGSGGGGNPGAGGGGGAGGAGGG
jgi:hypothetical protein